MGRHSGPYILLLLMGAALFSLPLHQILKPLLWLVLPALGFACVLQIQPLIKALVPTAVFLVVICTFWKVATTSLWRAFHSADLFTQCLIAMMALLTLLVVVLLAVAKVGVLGKPHQAGLLRRPTTRVRGEIAEPEGRADDGLALITAPPDTTDDLGLFAKASKSQEGRGGVDVF